MTAPLTLTLTADEALLLRALLRSARETTRCLSLVELLALGYEDNGDEKPDAEQAALDAKLGVALDTLEAKLTVL